MHPIIIELTQIDCSNGYPYPCEWCLPCRARVEVQRERRELGRIDIPPSMDSAIPVILESPYAGNIAVNTRYLQACIRDSIAQGEAPFASHRMYTEALDDAVDHERAAGISAGFAWRSLATRTVVYQDLGISNGMMAGIEHAESIGHELVFRTLGTWKA